MDAARWKILRDTFDDLVERPAPDRARRLSELADSDPLLHREVTAMLDGDAPVAQFSDISAENSAAPVTQEGPVALERTLGRYEIRQLLGRGGFGAVYRAFDPQLRREVALKTISHATDDLRARFRREAEIAASLVHPRIVTIHDFGEFDGREPFLVQELLPGEDLDELLARREPAGLAERLGILDDVLDGLAYAHRRGVVHRDVKPGNVRVLPDGHAKLLDFGIARVVSGGGGGGGGGGGVEGVDRADAADTSSLTGTGAAVGTLAYLPPEVLRGEKAGPAADVWGVGVLAFELLSFERPFRSKSPAAMVYDIAHGETPRLGADLPPGLGRWVEQAMARDPERRFPEAGVARLALREAVREAQGHRPAGGGPGASQVSDEWRTLQRRQRRQLAVVGSAAALLALGWWAITADRDPRGLLQVSPEVSPPATLPITQPITQPITPPVASSPTLAVPSPIPALPEAAPSEPARVGSLAIDALPWGTVIQVVNREGQSLPLPPDRRTPLALREVPATWWKVTLTGPDGTRRSCEVDLAESPAPLQAPTCVVVFRPADVRGFLASQR